MICEGHIKCLLKISFNYQTSLDYGYFVEIQSTLVNVNTSKVNTPLYLNTFPGYKLRKKVNSNKNVLCKINQYFKFEVLDFVLGFCP